MQAFLLLEDGFFMEGKAFTGPGEIIGEVVFSTGMLGYQEMITDPSYQGQILTFTYPLIGNYGINPQDNESRQPQVKAVLMKECCFQPSHRTSKENLASFLTRHRVMGVENIDTRTLTLHLRSYGTMKGIISTKTSCLQELENKLTAAPGIIGANLVPEVSTKKRYSWSNRYDGPVEFYSSSSAKIHIVVLDLGVKYSILRSLASQNCRVTVVPAATAAAEIKSLEPQGIVLSNGPGDPEALDYLLPTVKKLLGWKPLLGICLGHQLLGRALGLKTFKLAFGHRGINHPVQEKDAGKVLITAQNHGFCLCSHKKMPAGTRITHTSLFDGTLEGMESKDWGFSSVQFHPEASPGPHDSLGLFGSFIKLCT